MSQWNRLDPEQLPYRIDALSEDEWQATCTRCDWTMIRSTHVSARAATMYHYYQCPNRFAPLFDIMDVDEPLESEAERYRNDHA